MPRKAYAFVHNMDYVRVCGLSFRVVRNFRVGIDKTKIDDNIITQKEFFVNPYFQNPQNPDNLTEQSSV